MADEMIQALDQCERLTRRLRMMLALNLLALPFVGLLVFGGFTSRHPGPLLTDSLRVREVVIVDAKGVERVRLGTHLPDAVINGRRVSRGEDAAGILLYDDLGQERGGYVTFSPSRNVALTLDTRQHQAALFVADSSGGAAARLWRNDDWVEMRADEEGARLSVGQHRKLVFQQPTMTAAQAAAGCSDLKAELKQIKQQPPIEQILDECMMHMSGAVCRRCLGVKSTLQSRPLR
jgi:hypothetical protein